MGELSGLWSVLQESLKDVLQKYGSVAVLLLLALIYHVRWMNKMWGDRLKDKDKEIERLVAERDRLQEAILSKRLGSQGKPPPAQQPAETSSRTEKK